MYIQIFAGINFVAAEYFVLVRVFILGLRRLC